MDFHTIDLSDKLTKRVDRFLDILERVAVSLEKEPQTETLRLGSTTSSTPPPHLDVANPGNWEEGPGGARKWNPPTQEGKIGTIEDCVTCDGTGVGSKGACHICHGTGRVLTEH